MSALGDVLGTLARVFSERHVRWYLFGAQAVAVHAAARATQDVDVTVELPRAELSGLVRALEMNGFEHRFPEIAVELLDTGAVLPLVHTRTGMDLDLVLAGSGLETLILSRAIPATVDGQRVPVASPTDLVVLKILAGRGKDLDDVRSLLASGRVEIEDARDLLHQLEAALGQSDLIPRLDHALRDRR